VSDALNRAQRSIGIHTTLTPLSSHALLCSRGIQYLSPNVGSEQN
jgi:hypothetical protein